MKKAWVLSVCSLVLCLLLLCSCAYNPATSPMTTEPVAEETLNESIEPTNKNGAKSAEGTAEVSLAFALVYLEEQGKCYASLSEYEITSTILLNQAANGDEEYEVNAKIILRDKYNDIANIGYATYKILVPEDGSTELEDSEYEWEY